MEVPLPEKCFPDPELYNNQPIKNYLEKYIKAKVPKNDLRNFAKDFTYTFVLDRFSHVNQNKRPKVKKNLLTRKQRKELNLLKLPKNGWNYKDLLPMHELWKDYLRQNLDHPKKTPTYQDPDWTNFTSIIAKSELIGAKVTIVRSKVPTQIGMNGILVLETKMTFQLVTPASELKTILKETSVFEFKLDTMKFTIFGKHLITKPSERSVKKIKGCMIPDL